MLTDGKHGIVYPVNMKLSKRQKNILLTAIFLLIFLLVSNSPFANKQITTSPQSSSAPTKKTIETVKGEKISQPPKLTLNPNEQTVLVTKIIDGDTIIIEGDLKLRYIGIDTPETLDPRRKIQCFGKEASAKNKKLVLGKQIYIEKDVSETDRFGRLLRYVYSLNDQGEKIMVNEQLVKEGFAYASAYPPDIKYQKKLEEAEVEAREKQRGLWHKCNVKS